MLPSFRVLRNLLSAALTCKDEQGHETAGLREELEHLPDSYDALNEFAVKLTKLPLRQDWPYKEPSTLEEIWSECDPSRPREALGPLDPDVCARHAEAAFLGSVCGCVLGKPLEIDPTLEEVRQALGAIGEWPLRDYIPERIQGHFNRRLHGSWTETVRERIRWVAADDDINYTVAGMLLLEQHGIGFTLDNLRQLWLRNFPMYAVWGPERLLLLKAGMHTFGGAEPPPWEEWATQFNPKEEFCGAMIRVDAYGYACAGRPALAAELAWRDCSWSHRRTGVYGGMFQAAALACAPVLRDRLAIFETALKFVPQRSRFYKIVADALHEVSQAKDWLDGYQRLHTKYKEYTHCRVYLEAGTLINTLRFAEDVGAGICAQVCQGNDADSYGARAGSLLGAYFGPGHLEPRWLTPFNDDLHTTLAAFYERSLFQVAKRMGELPRRVAREVAGEQQKARRQEEGKQNAGTGLGH